MRTTRNVTVLSVLAILSLQCGCGLEEYRDVPQSPFPQPSEEWILAVIFDSPKEFGHQLSAEGAYDYFLKSAENFFHDRIGSDDKILLAHAGAGKGKTLIWEGKPLDLKRTFSTSEELQNFVEAQSNPDASKPNPSKRNGSKPNGSKPNAPRPNASRPYEGLADTIEYLTDICKQNGGHTKLAVIVLSGMVDESKRVEASKKKLVESLKHYKELGCGYIQFYGVSQDHLGELDEVFENAGLELRWRMGEPEVPHFE